jgi:Polyketide cyclase / dehydrase and lipid transport
MATGSVRLTNTVKVDAAPEEAWRVVGDLTAVDGWVPGVVSATVEGGRRLCETSDGGQIVEQITSYSAEERSYAYAHLHQPLPIANSRGRLSVRADGEGSLILWEAEFDAPSGEVAEMVESAYCQTLESLARLLDARPAR